MKGLIIKLQGGLYTVKTENKTYTAKGRGVLRHNNESPVVGDNIEMTIVDEEKSYGVIESIDERKNKMIRPNVANIDNAIVVTSIHEPYLNDYILDKMLMLIEAKEINPIIVFTKMDLIDKVSKPEEVRERIAIYKKIGYDVVEVDNTKGTGVSDLIDFLKIGTISVITGQTGVGKSTIINSINSSLKIDTGEISKSLGRGRHTTRHSELHELVDNVYIIDTPGFSSFDAEGLDVSEMNFVLKEFRENINKCKFNNCMHINEPGCYIKQAVENKEISRRRYTNYLKIIQEVKENER